MPSFRQLSARRVALTCIALAFVSVSKAAAQGRYGATQHPSGVSTASFSMPAGQNWVDQSQGTIQQTSFQNPSAAMSYSPYSSSGFPQYSAATPVSHHVPSGPGMVLAEPWDAPPCSTGDCVLPSSGDLADLMPFGWLQWTGGNEYGVAESWYTVAGLFLPLVILPGEDGLLFAQGDAFIAREDVYGANIGIVVREHENAADYFYGVGLWYDVESNRRDTFHQLGGSLELLSRHFEVRANGYFPIGTTSAFEPRTPLVVGTNTIIGRDQLALQGFDLEAGLQLFQQPRLWLFGGLYHYTDPENLLVDDPVSGARGRIEWRIGEQITLMGAVSDDNVFETQFYGGVVVAFRNLGDLCSPCRSDRRFSQLVRRRTRLMSVEQDRLQ